MSLPVLIKVAGRDGRWTAVAPDEVFTVQTYASDEATSLGLVRKSAARSRKTGRSQRYDSADPAPMISERVGPNAS